MKKVKYLGAVFTDSGKKDNEDSFLLMNHKKDDGMITFLCVADGVGGMSEGLFASSFVTESLCQWFEEEKENLQEQDIQEASSRLYEKTMQIHEALQMIEEERGITCGTTLTGSLLFKNRYVIVHVGDSRAFLWQDGGICRLTRDQTLAQKERDKGKEREKDKRDQKKKESTLLQCIGVGKIIPNIYEGNLPKEYAFLICSDGLSNTLTDRDICRELDNADVKAVKQHLIRLTSMAREREEKDNITSVIVKKIMVEVDVHAETETE